MIRGYPECVSAIEPLHRLLLDVVKAELGMLRIRAITRVRCMIIYSVAGDEISFAKLMLAVSWTESMLDWFRCRLETILGYPECTQADR